MSLTRFRLPACRFCGKPCHHLRWHERFCKQRPKEGRGIWEAWL
jgi:hypothetical protein